MPDFGGRFYTAPSFPQINDLKTDHRAQYLLRIAANIRDYIDQDDLPTVIAEPSPDRDIEIVSGFRPDFSWNIGTEPIAMGKESTPTFGEYAIYVRMQDVRRLAGNTREIDFTVDHYLEFVNPSARDFTAPTGTRLKLYSLPRFVGGTAGPTIQLPDIEVDLSGVVFPAGTAVVITTAPTAADDPVGMMQSGALVVRRFVDPTNNPVKREFKNQVGNQEVTASGLSGEARKFGIRFDGRDSTYTDYRSEMLLSTPNGYIDAFPFLSIAGTNQTVAGKSMNFEMTVSNNGAQGSWSLPTATRDKLLVWSSTQRGNDNLSRSGDARSVSEPLGFTRGSNSAFGNDQTRFFGNIQGNAVIPGTSTWGAPNSSPGNTFIVPTNWPDYHPNLTNSRDRAYAVVRSGAIRSIGELGHVYDPHRKASSESGASIRTARGGGRTLKIGQRDDTLGTSTARFGARSTTSVGWFNAAWRLTDYFAAADPAETTAPATAEGKLNINGVLRDNGLAFRAALRNFQFLDAPDGDPARANKVLSEPETTTLINAITTYLTNNGPIMERGELSQISFFDSGTAGQTPSLTAMDRSREEIFRRIVEAITTRSLSYSVYAIGQAVRQAPNGDITVLSTDRSRFVFQLTPTIGATPDSTVTDYNHEILYRTSN
jgi:hypothetical protein